MDSSAGLIKNALENGWRLGAVLFVAGGLVLVAHHFELPEPGILKEWLGWSSLAAIGGIALLATSAVIQVFEGIGAIAHRSRSSARVRAQTEAEEREVFANMTTLTREEADALLSMLKAGHPRFEVGFLSAAHPLIAKRVLIRRVAVGSNYLCKIHPAVIERREDIIQSLDAALKRHG